MLLTGKAPGWIGTRPALVIYALAAVGFYKWRLTRAAAGVSQWETIGKVVVFGVVVVAGFLALATEPPPPGALDASFRPVFAEGFAGLAHAMGYTFIALKGFDLIAAAGGEVRDPKRNVPPRDVPVARHGAGDMPAATLPACRGRNAGPADRGSRRGQSRDPGRGRRRQLHGVGRLLAGVAVGLISMLSALRINLLAASRFARTMGADRTLPPRLAHRPVVLVPIANPGNAETLVTMGKALAPLGILRVQLLSVEVPPDHYQCARGCWQPEPHGGQLGTWRSWVCCWRSPGRSSARYS